MSRAERRALVELEDRALPVTQQCRLLAVSRSSVYRRPVEISDEDLAIMALIDRQYLARPYYGSRRMAAWLATQGHLVNRKRVQRLMRLIGLVAIYQRPNTSKPAPENKVYPYLLGGLRIERVNQSLPPRRRGSGALTSPTSRCPRASFIWSRSWTGTAVGCWHGSCRTRSVPTPASRPLRRLWHTTAIPRSSTPTRACPSEGWGLPIHQHRVHRRARALRYYDQHGRQRPLHGQHLHRASVAQPEV